MLLCNNRKKLFLTVLVCCTLVPSSSSAFWQSWSKKQKTVAVIAASTIGITLLGYAIYTKYKEGINNNSHQSESSPQNTACNDQCVNNISENNIIAILQQAFKTIPMNAPHKELIELHTKLQKLNMNIDSENDLKNIIKEILKLDMNATHAKILQWAFKHLQYLKINDKELNTELFRKYTTIHSVTTSKEQLDLAGWHITTLSPDELETKKDVLQKLALIFKKTPFSCQANKTILWSFLVAHNYLLLQ